MRIELNQVSQTFGDQLVLDDLNLQADVTTLAIIGSSGGGKSTLLRLLGGLLLPSAGEVLVDGKLLPSEERELVKYRASVGFVFQTGGLFHHLSAVDNVVLPLRIVHQFSEEQAQKRAAELFERFGLGGEEHKYPAQLSGGQRQRVAIARAVAAQPKFLLLDEPTSALDPEYTAEVLSLLKDLADAGTNFVVVTHEMGFARHACDQVVFLADGKLLEYGEAEAVFSNPSNLKLQQFLAKLLEWRV